MQKKLVIVPLLALMLMSIMTGVAFADGPDPELSAASFSNPVSTFIRAQNLDSGTPANFGVTFYDTSGNPTTGSGASNIGSYYGADISQDAISAGFQGSAVLQSNTAAGAAVIQYTSGGTGLGSNFALDAYSSYVNSGGIANILYFPQLLKEVYDTGQNKTYNSLLVIQNTTDTPTNGTLTYTADAAWATATNPVVKSVSIPPNSSVYIDQATDPDLTAAGYVSGGGRPGGFFGTAVLNMNQPVLAVVDFYAPGVILTHQGFAQGYQTFYTPQILRNVFDSGQGITYDSGVSIVSVADPDSDGTVVNFTPTNDDAWVTGNCPKTTTMQATASPFAAFDQRFPPFSSYCSGNFFGSGVVTVDTSVDPNDQIVVIANFVSQANSKGNRSLTYSAFAPGTGTGEIFFPIGYNQTSVGTFGGSWTAGAQIQSLGGSGNIDFCFYPDGGGTPYCSYDVGGPGPRTISTAFGSVGLDPRFHANNVPTGFKGTLRLTSSLPIVAIMNIVGGNEVYGDGSGNYAGINQGTVITGLTLDPDSLPDVEYYADSTPAPQPTAEPTEEPTAVPTEEVTPEPTTEPTAEPTTEATAEPTTEPTAEPTAEPTTEPTVEPTAEPTTEPTAEPTAEPTTEPTAEPAVESTTEPTAEPTVEPTAEPTAESATEVVG